MAMSVGEPVLGTVVSCSIVDGGGAVVSTLGGGAFVGAVVMTGSADVLGTASVVVTGDALPLVGDSSLPHALRASAVAIASGMRRR